jgi:hypothetical protein
MLLSGNYFQQLCIVVLRISHCLNKILANRMIIQVGSRMRHCENKLKRVDYGPAGVSFFPLRLIGLPYFFFIASFLLTFTFTLLFFADFS